MYSNSREVGYHDRVVLHTLMKVMMMVLSERESRSAAKGYKILKCVHAHRSSQRFSERESLQVLACQTNTMELQLMNFVFLEKVVLFICD